MTWGDAPVLIPSDVAAVALFVAGGAILLTTTALRMVVTTPAAVLLHNVSAHNVL
jgi:hypothetical protein